MSYLKRFWNNIKNSFYNPEFYSQLRHKRFWKAILVLLGVSMISMLVICVMLAVTVGGFLKSFSSDDLVNTYYPDGLELTAKDNQFTSNVAEPYFIPLPDGDKHGTDTFTNAIVIDTSNDLTLEQIGAYDAFVVITKTGIAGKEDSGEMRVITLKQANLGDFVINEENATTWTTTAFKFIKIAVIPLLLFLFIFGSAFITLWHMFVLLFAALIVKIIAAIKKVEMPYPTAYIVALFATIPVLIVNVVLNTFIYVPVFIDLLLFIVVVSSNLKTTSASTSAPTETVEPVAETN